MLYINGPLCQLSIPFLLAFSGTFLFSISGLQGGGGGGVRCGTWESTSVDEEMPRGS